MLSKMILYRHILSFFYNVKQNETISYELYIQLTSTKYYS